MRNADRRGSIIYQTIEYMNKIQERQNLCLNRFDENLFKTNILSGVVAKMRSFIKRESLGNLWILCLKYGAR